MQQAKPLFWFSHKEEKSDTSKDVSLNRMVSPILTQWTTLSEDFVLLEDHHGHGIADRSRSRQALL
ncbi:hypothetical protein, partial [Burkholderia orbicola]